ncbi:MAG: CHC2 zinc finger domain-containing protein [Cyanobacteria bacterium]|nr:CHC2 zinc finger domain-containing protein [Cyanobacteriota bacterium]
MNAPSRSPPVSRRSIWTGIPDALLEAVRERARITDLFPQVDLQRRGAEFLTLCPRHQDSNASLTVSPRTNRVHCFVCNKGADPIAWLQDRQGLSFREAVEELARRYALPLPVQDPEAAAKAEAERQERQRLRQWRSRQEEEFHQALVSDLQASGAAALYLQQRGISPETAIAWRLGLNGSRLMLPIRDAMGRCCGFSGRSLNGEEPMYRNSSGDLLFQKSQLLFGLDKATEAIRRSSEALLVEGPLDVIQLHQAGLDNAVAALGTAVTIEQLQRLQRSGTKRLWLAYDGDSAGANATARLIGIARPLLLRGDLDLLVVPVPPGEDPDSLLRSQGVSGLRACLAQGRHWLHWELDRLLADLHNHPDDLSILQRCEHQGAELLALLPEGALRRKAEHRLQQALGGLPPAAHNTAQSGETKDQAPSDTNVQQAERRALHLFLCNPGLREVLSVLELADPLHREAMGWLWCLQQRLVGSASNGAASNSDSSCSGEQAIQGDGLRAAVIAALPSMDPPLAQLLSPLLYCGEPVRVKLAAQPEPELMCILDVLEPVG